MQDTLAWERIGWLILKLACLTCLLPENEKAKHLLFHIGFYVGEELRGVLGWLGKGRDLEKLPASTWHLFLLCVALCSVSGYRLVHQELVHLGASWAEAVRGGRNGRKRRGGRRWEM